MLMDLADKDTRAQPLIFSLFLALHSLLIPVIAKNYLAPWFRPNITSFGKPVNLIWKFTLFFLCYLEVPITFIFRGCFYVHRTYCVHMAPSFVIWKSLTHLFFVDAFMCTEHILYIWLIQSCWFFKHRDLWKSSMEEHENILSSCFQLSRLKYLTLSFTSHIPLSKLITLAFHLYSYITVTDTAPTS